MGETAQRSCEVCGNRRVAPLHTQPFSLPGGGTLSYRVVACEGCGFVYADGIPSPAEYARYYADSQKYTYEGSKSVPRGLATTHEGTFRVVDDYLTRARGKERFDAKLVDVGCATGHLLSYFKKAGYRDLHGLEPAPECRDIAKRLYDLDVTTGSLEDLPDARWEVVLLSSVVEHLPQATDSLAHVARRLVRGGLVMVQVPDADNFGVKLREPFLEFSLEHINYFTRTSLRNLMGAVGFAERLYQRDLLDNQGTTFPALTTLWEKTGSDGATVVPDTRGREAIAAYIARCNELQAKLAAAIDALVDAQQPMIVWGTGSLTARLLATTRLKQAKIERFVDSNTALQGKQLEGVPIEAPSTIAGKELPVLIASYVYAGEIRRTLEGELGYRGRIVNLP